MKNDAAEKPEESEKEQEQKSNRSGLDMVSTLILFTGTLIGVIFTFLR